MSSTEFDVVLSFEFNKTFERNSEVCLLFGDSDDNINYFIF